MRASEFTIKDIDREIDRLEKENAALSKDLERADHGAYGQSTNQIQKNSDRIRRLLDKKKELSGEVKVAKFSIPEELNTEVHDQLHKIWKNLKSRDIPWRMYYGPDFKTVDVVIRYTDPQTKGPNEDSGTIQDLIDYLKTVSTVPTN